MATAMTIRMRPAMSIRHGAPLQRARPVLCPVRAAPAATTQVQTAPGLELAQAEVVPFDADQFQDLVTAAAGRLVVVDVFTTWCGPCKMIAPELEKMAAEFTDVVIAKLDCTSNNINKKWAMEQKVKALPTFIMFKDGQRVNDMTGSKASALRALIAAHK